VQPTLARAAFVFLSAGQEQGAEELLNEALAGFGALGQLGFSVIDLSALALVALAFGREGEIRALIESEPFQSPWIEAARAVVSGDFRRGADILEPRHKARAAFLRLCAAEQLVAEGRRAEADEQLTPALAFYRSVGATRYVREGEALLAASA
jgi:hypothetical protein